MKAIEPKSTETARWRRELVVTSSSSKKPEEEVDLFELGWSTYVFDPELFLHKEYPNCIQCSKKYVPISKGEMICFSCSFTRR